MLVTGTGTSTGQRYRHKGGPGCGPLSRCHGSRTAPRNEGDTGDTPATSPEPASITARVTVTGLEAQSLRGPGGGVRAQPGGLGGTAAATAAAEPGPGRRGDARHKRAGKRHLALWPARSDESLSSWELNPAPGRITQAPDGGCGSRTGPPLPGLRLDGVGAGPTARPGTWQRVRA